MDHKRYMKICFLVSSNSGYRRFISFLRHFKAYTYVCWEDTNKIKSSVIYLSRMRAKYAILCARHTNCCLKMCCKKGGGRKSLWKEKTRRNEVFSVFFKQVMVTYIYENSFILMILWFDIFMLQKNLEFCWSGIKIL